MEQSPVPDPEDALADADEVVEFEPRPLPRWAQVAAGIFLLPITLVSLMGSGSIFGIPKVQGDPLLQLLAAVICLLCLWTVVLAVRLIFGLRGRGLMGPHALRATSISAIALVLAAFSTGVWREHPYRSALLSVVYIVVAIRMWKVAAYRSRSVA